jgi:type IV pilus assembly protein PilV
MTSFKRIRQRLAPARDQRGSFVIEALVSLLIFTVGIMALVGLATQSLNQIGQTKARNDASFLAGELIGQMWVSSSAPSSFSTTAWQAKVAAALPNGTATVTPDATNPTQIAITITWSDPKNNSVTHSYQTTAIISRNSS